MLIRQHGWTIDYIASLNYHQQALAADVSPKHIEFPDMASYEQWKAGRG